MPCKDSTSTLTVELTHDDILKSFEYKKITCQQKIGGTSGYSSFCQGQTVKTVLSQHFIDVVEELDSKDEEEVFFLYLEWEALRAALAQYTHETDIDIDESRYPIVSIEWKDDSVVIRQNVTPPQEMPKIATCSSQRKAL